MKKKDLQDQNIELQDKKEEISIKEGERIGLGLRNMQTQADILKRKKRRKRKIIIIILILLIIIISVVVYQIKKSETESTTVESSEAAVAGENQEIILGEILEISGNEMTFTLVEEEESTDSSEDSKKGEGPNSGMQRGQQTGESQSIDGANEQAGEGGVPDQSSMDTSEGMQMNNGEMPDMSGMQSDDEASTKESSKSGEMMPEATIETKTYRSLGEERIATIPVGTDVITKLGTVTTFARLAAGDVVQMLTEKDGDGDVIIKMWIVG